MSNRIKEASAIEARLLELAHTTDAQLSATTLAYYAPCSIEDAARVLDDLSARGTLSMDVQDDGSITYTMYGRQKLGAAVPRLRPEVQRQTALVPFTGQRHASPALAAILTAFVPGAGHLYAGRFVSAFLWFLVVGAGYALFIPGLILHLFAMVSAANAARRLDQPRVPLLLAA